MRGLHDTYVGLARPKPRRLPVATRVECPKKMAQALLEFIGGKMVLAGLVVAVCAQRAEGVGSSTLAPTRNSSCSQNDATNGSLCTCGTVLRKHCGELRGKTSIACTDCVKAIACSNCTSVMQTDFCGGCSPKFNFEWIDQLPPNPDNHSVLITDMDQACGAPNAQRGSTLYDSMMDVFRLTDCSEHLMYGFLTGLGLRVLKMDNNNVTHEYESAIHGSATVDFAVDCCKNFESEPNCGGRTMNTVWLFVRKATQCQKDKIVNGLAEAGLDVDDVDPNNPFGVAYNVDLRKVSFVGEPLIAIAIKQDYSSTFRYLLGLTLAAAYKHQCGTSWFMPGADHMFADVFRVQGNFYFPAAYPSSFEPTGTCGLSMTSVKTRLAVCEKVTKFLYDNANISGMSILACTVDCTGSKRDGVDGSFVSIVIPIVEVDTRSTGFPQQNGGIAVCVAKLNAEGFDITDDLHQTVGASFNFTSRLLGSDDVFNDVNWDASDTKFVSKIPFDVTPNMTEAQQSYKIPNKPSEPTKSPSTAVIVVAVVSSVVLMLTGILVGLSCRIYNSTAIPPQTITTNQGYEDDDEDEDEQLASTS
eukprot:m.62857 g.62857  ORF g.62857 m.62857 type:complete len:585 (-) comp23210_c0_seq1:84-1838(-)